LIIVDANVVIGWLEQDNPNHKRAAQLMSELTNADDILAMHEFTFAECLVGPARDGEQRQYAEVISRSILVLEPELLKPLEIAEFCAQHGVAVPDGFVLRAATNNHAKLATFDSRFARKATAAGVVVYGAEAP